MRLSHLLAWLDLTPAPHRSWGIRRIKNRFGGLIAERAPSPKFQALVAEKRAKAQCAVQNLTFGGSSTAQEVMALHYINDYLDGFYSASPDPEFHNGTPPDDLLAEVAACLQLASAMPRPAPSASPNE